MQQSHHGYVGLQIDTPSDIMFLPGFMCQLFVSFLSKLNVCALIYFFSFIYNHQSYQEEISTIKSNRIIFRCPGLFNGEVIVMVDASNKIITMVLMATKPNVEWFISIFQKLCQMSFNQCILLFFCSFPL